ncbi:MAG: nucleoside-diphosphate kinase [Parachlamydiales bacterium]|nr:nucleoside-diphosphate kinase [Parachlamydiales bacterium]
MAKEQTLSIVKPDAVGNNNIGSIISYLEKSGLQVVAMKMLHLSKEQAGEFYAIHKERPFYGDLVKFMTSGPVLVMALEGENAVAQNRKVMGATNPEQAEVGTIRRDFAKTLDENAVHGSDSLDNAKIEINFFFKPNEICARTR